MLKVRLYFFLGGGDNRYTTSRDADIKDMYTCRILSHLQIFISFFLVHDQTFWQKMLDDGIPAFVLPT